MHSRLKHTPKNMPPRPIWLPLESPALRLLLILQQTSVRLHRQRAGQAKTLILPKDYNHRSDVTALSTAPFTPARPAPAPSTVHSGHDHGQSSTTKRSLLLAWYGVEQLLQKVEGCLGGTPFKVPVGVLNTLIDIGKVCSHLAVSRCTD